MIELNKLNILKEKIKLNYSIFWLLRIYINIINLKMNKIFIKNSIKIIKLRYCL